MDTVVNKADVAPSSTELMVEEGRQIINKYGSYNCGLFCKRKNVGYYENK